MQRIANKFKHRVFLLLVISGLSGLAEHATISIVSGEADYELLDTHGEYRLVEKNNDIWMEKLDGRETKQITRTPSIRETFAIFSKDGQYIVYAEQNNSRYIVKSGCDDGSRKEINFEEISNIIGERRGE
ncbi:MAG: hypothetical protein WCI77_04420 [Candidatus Omnitrophota bacterium]